MKIDQFIQLFVVKEKKFFPKFSTQGTHIFKAAELLTLLVSEQDESKKKEIYKKIKEEEVLNDKVTGSIYEDLSNSFVTPFDREDIHSLASTVDDVLDLINDTSKRIIMYAYIDSSEMRPIANILYQQTELLKLALDGLDTIRKSPEKIERYCRKVRRLEGDADQLYEEYVTKMFKTETNVLNVIKNKSIIQGLEEATDSAKDAAGVIHRMIVKLA